MIKGKKGGSSSSRTPVESPDSLVSTAYAKILMAISEGETYGSIEYSDIYLDGTPCANPDGTKNFDIEFDYRNGTQDQTYIQGMPETANEITLGTEITSDKPWLHTVTDSTLSAIRVRLEWPSLLQQNGDNGDIYGYRINYLIEISTDGGAYQTYLSTAVDGKTTSGYERSHRIDLPKDGSQWTIRVRRTTVNSTSAKISDKMKIASYTEIIDAKLTYPLTSLLFIKFDASKFNGSIPKIGVLKYGKEIRVPSNYDAFTRKYSGVWDGTFKWSWSNNPAWVMYDLISNDRYGLGDRIKAENLDRYEFYSIAQYCDELVPDGRGSEECRYTCNVYIQNREDAFAVLRDFAAMFRGMTYWYNNKLVVIADIPRDIDYVYTRANIINGEITYSSSSSKARYTSALVSYSDPDNQYKDATEAVFEQDLITRYKVFNQLETTAIGCTSQAEANRRGRWAILTNNKDRIVSFKVGLDGMIPLPGYIIGVADQYLSGKIMGGRISQADGKTITLDRVPDAKPNDTLIVNLPSGKAEERTIISIAGKVLKVAAPYSENPQLESVWCVESTDVNVQQYRVISVKNNDDNTFSIRASYHDPDKFLRIDNGAILDSRPISLLPSTVQSVPTNVVISANYSIEQGLSIATLHAQWDKPDGAVYYEVQWRKDLGNWINATKTSTTSFDIQGVYSGIYEVRVCAINAVGVTSQWTKSDATDLKGKDGLPPMPINFKASTDVLFGIALQWNFPEGTGDTNYTEIQYSTTKKSENAIALSNVTYPMSTYLQSGLKVGQEFYYRARLVDKIGNESEWTECVRGVSSSDTSELTASISNELQNSDAWKSLVDDNNALKKDISAQANEINKLSLNVNGINASVTESNNIVKKLDESISAYHTLQIKVDKKGQQYVAGMSIGIEETEQGIQSNTIFLQDRFSIMNAAGGDPQLIFTTSGNQVIINEAVIGDASITNAKIGNILQSDNFQEGKSGWQLTKNTGTLKAIGADISGKIIAKSGEMDNVVINENCQIKGKLSVSQIEGDVSKGFSIKNNETITIAPVDYDRTLYIPSIICICSSFPYYNAISNSISTNIYVVDGPYSMAYAKVKVNGELVVDIKVESKRNSLSKQASLNKFIPKNQSTTIYFESGNGGSSGTSPESIFILINKS